MRGQWCRKFIEFCVMEKANGKIGHWCRRSMGNDRGAEPGSAKYQISQDQPQNWQEQEKDKQKVGERERRSPWRGATLRCHTAETSFLSLLACWDFFRCLASLLLGHFGQQKWVASVRSTTACAPAKPVGRITLLGWLGMPGPLTGASPVNGYVAAMRMPTHH